MAQAATRRKKKNTKKRFPETEASDNSQSVKTTRLELHRSRWKSVLLLSIFILTPIVSLAIYSSFISNGSRSLPLRPRLLPAKEGMLLIPGGRYSMGQDFSLSSDASPMHEVVLDAFWLDEHEVTNSQFALFVDETDYVTTAERIGSSSVFDLQAQRWRIVPDANWKHPGGAKTTITGRDNQPVVQVSYDDALAYCHWAGKRLPTEAEWERAARGGLYDADYPWGRKELIAGRFSANYWQGPFPYRDDGDDGRQGIANIGSYPPNPYGLFDMAGNVAEWCADRYAEDYYSAGENENPQGPLEGKTIVVRGGSWISAEINGAGFKVWARDHLSPSESNNHTGFRCAKTPTRSELLK